MYVSWPVGRFLLLTCRRWGVIVGIGTKYLLARRRMNTSEKTCCESTYCAVEVRTHLNDTLRGVVYHKKCHDCGRFLPRERLVRTDNISKAHGLCRSCVSQYDDLAFL